MIAVSERCRSLKRVAIFQIRFRRFSLVFCPHVVIAKPLHTFARHALDPEHGAIPLIAAYQIRPC
jgi:hypothetical protein